MQSTAKVVEYQANLTIHEQDNNVIISGIQDEAMEYIYLGDNKDFRVGDIVEIIQAQESRDHRTEISAKNKPDKNHLNAPSSLFAASQSKVSPRIVKQQSSKQVPDFQLKEINCTESSKHRTSLVVTLNQSFYKVNPQPKKFFVSIEQSLADLHGLRKDMAVTIRRIRPQDLESYHYPSGEEKPLVIQSLQKRKHELVADRVEVTVRDQFASRRDMWQLIQSLNLKTIYKGHQVDLDTVRFKIRNIFTTSKPQSISPTWSTNGSRTHHYGRSQSIQVAPPNQSFHQTNIRRETSQTPANKNNLCKKSEAYIEQTSAIVSTQHTRFTFFSKSCQVYCLIELSKEMFDFDAQGFLQAEKMQIFVRNYLERCKADSSTHEIVFILYARLYYPQVGSITELLDLARKKSGRSNMTLPELECEGVFQFSKGKVFRDVYQKAGVVTLSLDTNKTDYDKFLVELQRQIEKFPQIVDWQINCPTNLSKQSQSSSNLVQFQLNQPRQNSALMIECELGDSERTNILEVINLALFNLNNEEVDMNLRTTGTQILILTAGMATYRVNKAIIAPTKSRILLGGIQIKLISFAREPPYRTPQLIDCCLYTNPFEKKKQSSKSQFQTPVKPRLTSDSQFFHHEERRDKTNCSDFQSKVLDWMQVTFLPHIKLLETHLSKEQRKKSTALLHLSKTPLLAPQFCKFQQAQMVTKVFNGVTKQNERLFEPHSMFVRSLSDIKNKIAQTNKQNDKSLLEPTPRNSQTSRSLKNQKQKKFWRMDPNAYQLRQPNDRDLAYLLDQTGGISPLFSDQIISEEISSKGDGYQSDNNISMNIMTTSPEKTDAAGDQFIASKEQAKQKLRQRMSEYDDKFCNAEKLQTKKLSPVSSINSSPVKSIIMPGYGDSQFLTEKTNMNSDQIGTIFTSNILKPETKDNIQVDDPLFKQSATSNLIIMNQSSTVQKQALKSGDKPQLRSYLRRWGHAVSICQLNFFNNQQVSSQSQQIEPADSKPYSTSFDQLPEHGGFDRTKNAYDLAVTQNYFDPLCKLMDSFWKQFSDVSLFPLTSQSFPNFEIKKHSESNWNNNPQSIQNQEIEDNLCLRLTQNFQFINERGCCFFPKAEGVRTKRYKMSIRDVYSMKTDAVQDQRWFEIKTYFKYKQSESELEETEAAFNYLLFNPHTDTLMPKRSQETRLFSVKKLWELDNVLEAFADHRESCIKLPAVCFVIYYDREKAHEACKEDDSGKQQLTYEQLMNKHVQEEQKEEEAFKYLCAKLEQNMGFFSLRGIQVVKQSQVDQNFILADSKAPQQPYSNLYDESTVQNPDSTDTQKQRQQSEMLGEVSDFHDKKLPWSHDIIESFIEQPKTQNNNLLASQAQRPGQGGLPVFGMNGGQESSRQSIASSSFDQGNQSMQDPGINDTFNYLPHQFPLSQSVAARAPSASVTYRKRDLDGRNNNPQSLKKKKQLYTLKKENSQQQSQDQLKNTRQCQAQKCENQYLLEHDSCYTTGACFHLKLQWIFCRGPDIQERIIKRLQRQVKEISKDCFKTLPLSEIIRRMQLNPFESNTILRDDYRIKEKVLLEQREEEEKLEYMKKSFNAGPDFEMKIEMINSIDEEQIRSEGQAFKNTQTVIKSATKSEQFERNRTKATEELFLKLLGGVLTNQQTGYILDNKSKDEQKTYYLEKESGLCYVKHETSNRVTFSENDIVNNSHTDYLQSIKVRQKTEATLIALEVLVDILYTATDGGELNQK